MKKKLKCVLLIDDDEPTNLFNSAIILEAGCTEKIQSCSSGPEGLAYLKSEMNGKHPKPEIIFLDINMPGMDGWEFLDEYNKLPISQKGEIIVVMLTTSLNPEDKIKAVEYGAKGFSNKPLTVEGINGIIGTYFPDAVE